MKVHEVWKDDTTCEAGSEVPLEDWIVSDHDDDKNDDADEPEGNTAIQLFHERTKSLKKNE